jgi:hypothetical protein
MGIRKSRPIRLAKTSDQAMGKKTRRGIVRLPKQASLIRPKRPARLILHALQPGSNSVAAARLGVLPSGSESDVGAQAYGCGFPAARGWEAVQSSFAKINRTPQLSTRDWIATLTASGIGGISISRLRSHSPRRRVSSSNKSAGGPFYFRVHYSLL